MAILCQHTPHHLRLEHHWLELTLRCSPFPHFHRLLESDKTEDVHNMPPPHTINKVGAWPGKSLGSWQQSRLLAVVPSSNRGEASSSIRYIITITFVFLFTKMIQHKCHKSHHTWPRKNARGMCDKEFPVSTWNGARRIRRTKSIKCMCRKQKKKRSISWFLVRFWLNATTHLKGSEMVCLLHVSPWRLSKQTKKTAKKSLVMNKWVNMIY